MDCTLCSTKKCRSLEQCNAQVSKQDVLLNEYHVTNNQELVQQAAKLVDGGRAGTLSRLQEIIELTRSMKFRKLGLAYCYGMEKEAKAVANHFNKSGINVSAVSCTTGALAQEKVNKKSELPGVSCNPIAQATQLNNEGADLVVVMGLCLGHDIIFQKYITGYVTTLVVKDRVYAHNPMEEINKLGYSLPVGRQVRSL